MISPTANVPGQKSGGSIPEAGFLCLETLKKRSDFLRAARGKRAVTPGFILQATAGRDDGMIRVGFTCSKKVGNAVVRNRAKRRLREVARHVLRVHGVPGSDYVFIGRAEVTAARTFETLINDCTSALDRLS